MEDNLIIRAKRGNKKAKEQLVGKFQPIIHSLIKQFRFPKDDYADMVQEGNIGILTAIQKYSLTSRFPLSSLVYLEAKKRMFDFVLQSNTISTRYKKNKINIVEYDATEKQSDEKDISDVMIYDEVIEELISELFTLDDLKRFIIGRKYGLFGHIPHTYKQLVSEVYKRFHIKYSEQQIENIIYKTIADIRFCMKAKGIDGGDIWKIKNKMTQTRKGRRGQNFLKVMSGGMVVKVVSTTRGFWRMGFFYR
jgi:DNA-directed RNA polymerase sigma subunit (sigma70/sigma32)